MLASGRPGIGFWVSPKADGAEWIGYDVEAEHSKNLPSDPWDAAHGTGTTSYTGIAEVEPGVVLLACVPLVTVLPRVLNLSRAVLRVAVVHHRYDKTSGAGRSGDVQKVYSVRITVSP